MIMRMSQFCKNLVVQTAYGAVAFLLTAAAHAEEGAFSTPLTPARLDPAATAEWVDGQVKPRVDFLEAGSKPHFPNPLAWVVAMPPARMGWGQIAFGAEGAPGPRHLRIGLNGAYVMGGTGGLREMNKTHHMKCVLTRWTLDVGR